MSKLNKGMFSSYKDDWETPQRLFDELNSEFNFTTDVCASEENKKCSVYFTKENSCLDKEWVGTCWMNPPYGRVISSFLKKAYEESVKGVTTVCLIPARTDTKYWHDYCMKGEVRFIKGRLKFSDSKNYAPFPSAIVIFRGQR